VVFLRIFQDNENNAVQPMAYKIIGLNKLVKKMMLRVQASENYFIENKKFANILYKNSKSENFFTWQT